MTQDNPIIAKRFQEKMNRLDKTSLSILISWSINAALDTLSEEERGGNKWQKLVEERKDWFIGKYREFMMENMPVEPNGEFANKITPKQAQEQSETEKWQKHYNEISATEAINNELLETN